MRKIEPVELDADGIVRHPNVHDARLEAISIAKPKVSLSIVDVEGTRFELVLERVERFCATDFREGNIIFDIDVVKESAAIERAELWLLYGLRANEGERPDFLNDVLARVDSGKLLFVRLTSSYGCSLVALCGEVAVQGE